MRALFLHQEFGTVPSQNVSYLSLFVYACKGRKITACFVGEKNNMTYIFPAIFFDLPHRKCGISMILFLDR